MAAWLAHSSAAMDSLALNRAEHAFLWRAIHARRIMDGATRSLSATDEKGEFPVPDDQLPEHFWHPTLPQSHTLAHLATARPALRTACAQACIAANYQTAYDHNMAKDDTLFDWRMLGDAEGGGKTCYVEHLLARQARLGIQTPRA